MVEWSERIFNVERVPEDWSGSCIVLIMGVNGRRGGAQITEGLVINYYREGV